VDHRPFAHLNLRRNPFGDLSGVSEPLDRVGTSVSEWADWLATSRRMIEFVGPRGCGKSVRLRALANLVASADDGAVEVVEVEGRAPLEWHDAEWLFVDEAQFVRTEEWRRLAASPPAGLAVASHESLERVAKRLAFDRRSIDCATVDARRISQMVHTRIEAVRRKSGAPPSVSEEACDWLMSKYGANLRRCVSHLYEVFQRLEHPVEVTVRHLESTAPPEPSSIQPHPRAAIGDGLVERMVNRFRHWFGAD
jgi:energy-coupling factor transporter ATP-binding protein EcfA2